MAPEFLGGLAQSSEGAFLPPADMFSLGGFDREILTVSPGMVVLRMLCHVDMEDSELFRMNDKLRKNPARELKELFRYMHNFFAMPMFPLCHSRPSLASVAIGTSKGNLDLSSRDTYLPLLLDLLQDLLTSCLTPDPSSRITAFQAKTKTNSVYDDIFKHCPSLPCTALHCPAMPCFNYNQHH